MASLKDIRARIESTKNTQQITKAMKLVSAAKLRRAQSNIVNMRPYSLTLRRVIADIAATKKVSHPLMEKKQDINKVLLLVISSDRGLCGGFNSNVIKYTENFLNNQSKAGQKIDLYIVGRKAGDYFQRRGVSAVKVITKMDKDICYKLASEVADEVLKGYLDGQYDCIKILFNEFHSALSQTVVCETVIPIDEKLTTFEDRDSSSAFALDMLFEPEPEKIIEALLIKHFNLQVYRCMSESVASEHGARMTAMENSSKNAKSMIDSLTLTYNKLRQEKITTELTEIVSGAEALK